MAAYTTSLTCQLNFRNKDREKHVEMQTMLEIMLEKISATGKFFIMMRSIYFTFQLTFV